MFLLLLVLLSLMNGILRQSYRRGLYEGFVRYQRGQRKTHQLIKQGSGKISPNSLRNCTGMHNRCATVCIQRTDCSKPHKAHLISLMADIIMRSAR